MWCLDLRLPEIELNYVLLVVGTIVIGLQHNSSLGTPNQPHDYMAGLIWHLSVSRNCISQQYF